MRSSLLLPLVCPLAGMMAKELLEPGRTRFGNLVWLFMNNLDKLLKRYWYPKPCFWKGKRVAHCQHLLADQGP